MNISELKIDVNLKSTQEEVISKIQQFIKLMGELEETIEPKIIEKKNDFEKEFKNFFKANDFSVITERETTIKASNEKVDVKLTFEGFDSKTFRFDILSKNIYKVIEIRATKDFEDLLVWRHNLRDINTMIFWDGTYSSEIMKIDNIETLNKLSSELSENIEWYKATLNEISKITYTYGIYDEDIEFKTFEEFFAYI